MFFMADIELINLVTTRLVQNKKEVEYRLRGLVDGDTPPSYQKYKVDLITECLDDYQRTIGHIQLWESLLDEITNVPEEKKEGDNNN
jgi:hypothetical protein